MSLVLDIETSNLDPRRGVIFCVGILDDEANTIRCYGENGESERYILLRTARAISNSTEVVTFSGTRFDLPFINYRNAVHRLPKIKPDRHVDVQRLLPRQANGHPASLEKSCRRYGIDSKQTPYSDALWQRARLGDTEALSAIAQHCREDIVSLRDLYYVVIAEDNMEDNSPMEGDREYEDVPVLDDLNENVLAELDAVHQFEYGGAVKTDDPHPMEYQTEFQN